MQLQVIDEQIEEELLGADFQALLAPHEGEALPQFRHEAGQVLEQGVLHLALPGLIPMVQEIEDIGVLQALAG